MQLRVAVQNPDGSPAMPTKPSRARRWVRDGKATGHWNDAGIYYVQLVRETLGRQPQPIVICCDPGKSYSGIAVQSAKSTLYLAHLILSFQRVKERLGAPVIKKGKVIKNSRGRHLQRRVRRGRRINREIPFQLRAHRQKSKLAPSIKASRQMEIRVISELVKIFPVSSIVYEMVKADVDLTSGRNSARSGKGFSPVMAAQKWCVEQLSNIAPVEVRYGWHKNGNGTSQIRKHLGLVKVKDKKAQTPESHDVDGIVLAAGQFVQYRPTHTANTDGYEWAGRIEITPAPFRVITRPAYFRRALHFDNPLKGRERKRKGETITPWGFRSGDLVQATKADKVYRGWVGGYTEGSKSISLCDINWKRIGRC